MGRTPTGQTRERVLAFVRGRLLAGAPPTVREVQEAFGFRSVGTAREHLDALVAAGELERPAEGRHRGLCLRGGGGLGDGGLGGGGLGGGGGRGGGRARGGGAGGSLPRLVPLLGAVQAGALTEAIAHAEDHVVTTAATGGARSDAAELFALRVRGDSMVPELLPDDVIVVRRQPSAEHGELVVAMVDGDATVKRLRLVRGRVELHAANPRYAPIVPPSLSAEGGLELLGKVIELRRSYDRGPRSGAR